MKAKPAARKECREESLGISPRTRAFIGDGAKGRGPDARQALVEAALELVVMNESALGGPRDWIYYILIDSATEAGLRPGEVEQVVDAISEYCERTSYGTLSRLPAELAYLLAPGGNSKAVKAARLDAHLRALWEGGADEV